MERLYQEALVYYRNEENQAIQMAEDPIGPSPEGVPVAELASMVLVANALLNLDEFLMKPEPLAMISKPSRILNPWT